MSLTIGSNIASLKAQRSLDESSKRLSTTFERLSSGLRINRAADDAAGLAISANLNYSSRVFAQGLRNLNDGASALAIADGSLEQLTLVVTRIKELAEQAANGTLGVTQRRSIDTEAQELAKEFFRITKTTEFNDRKLFESSFGKLRLQADFGIDGSIESGLGGAIGAGTFNSSLTYASAAATDAVTADFNGDGFIDIASVGGANTGEILLGTGTGSFGAAITFDTGTNPAQLAVSDFNGDGMLDLVSADGGTGTLSVLLGRGDGTFAARRTLGTGTNPSAVKAGDLNGDGKIDLVVSNSFSSSATIFLGNGDGSFSNRGTFATGSQPRDIELADFNGDKILDIVTADSSDTAFSVLLGRGNGTFGTRTAYNLNGDPTDIASADFNGDGVLDLAFVGDNGASSADVVLGVGNGTFLAARSFSGSSLNDILATDVNGDGAVDLVGVAQVGTKLEVILGNGNGSFLAPTTFSNAATYDGISAGDFNGDGVIDIATVGVGSTYTRVFLANTVDGVAPLLSFSLKYQHEALQALPMLTNKLDQLSN